MQASERKARWGQGWLMTSSLGQSWESLWVIYIRSRSTWLKEKHQKVITFTFSGIKPYGVSNSSHYQVLPFTRQTGLSAQLSWAARDVSSTASTHRGPASTHGDKVKPLSLCRQTGQHLHGAAAVRGTPCTPDKQGWWPLKLLFKTTF